MASLFATSSVPDHGSGLGHQILFLKPQWQNLLHVPVYALLTWLWFRGFSAWGKRALTAALLAAAIAVGFGALDEVHQYFVPGRYASGTDASLNALGAILAAASCLLLRPSS